MEEFMKGTNKTKTRTDKERMEEFMKGTNKQSKAKTHERTKTGWKNL